MRLHFILAFVLLQGVACHAQNVPVHAEGLLEEMISVELPGGNKQAGVYSVRRFGGDKPTKLAVLLPGHPSVVRPVVDGGVMTGSGLKGNFLIRARRFLVDETVASLIVDCQSESGDVCSSSYQASKQRQEDVDRLIAEVKRRSPTIAEIWIVGNSMGTVSSSFMPLHNQSGYAGAIHTSSITDPYAKNSYKELSDFDYKKSLLPQFFVHHANDPCRLTTYSSAKAIAERHGVPLLTVSGGSEFRGSLCGAFTEHSFKGKEKEVMTAISALIKSGKATQLEIN